MFIYRLICDKITTKQRQNANSASYLLRSVGTAALAVSLTPILAQKSPVMDIPTERIEAITGFQGRAVSGGLILGNYELLLVSEYSAGSKKFTFEQQLKDTSPSYCGSDTGVRVAQVTKTDCRMILMGSGETFMVGKYKLSIVGTEPKTIATNGGTSTKSGETREIKIMLDIKQEGEHEKVSKVLTLRNFKLNPF